MSSRYDETINQFKFGDHVKVKGKKQEMIVVSNVPGGGINIEHYLKTDKFICEWIDENGNEHREMFNGSDLELA